MFADEDLDPVRVESVWRKTQQGAQESRACQTPAVAAERAGVQTGSKASRFSQTEPAEQMDPNRTVGGSGSDPPALVDFLRRVEEPLIRELEKNCRSHAFDGFRVKGEERSQQVCQLHRLEHPGAQDQGLHVTSVSWSCTGSVLACAYGRTDAGDWTHLRSCVCLWNLDRRRLRPRQPDLVLDAAAAVTAVRCHPDRPALVAGGLFNGEVLVWDTSRTQDPVLAQTGMSADSHREPVYQVFWVPLQKKGDFGVLSSGSGGRVLLWALDPEPGRMVLVAAYAFVQQQVPRSMKGGGGAVGVTATALSPFDSDTFLVGSEGGLLLRCSFSSPAPAAVTPVTPGGRGVTPRAPAVFCFRPSGGGPVHSVHCSPFHRNLFASAGTDGLVQVRSLLQAEPLMSVRVCDSYVFQVQWSPSRPLVFGAATGSGEVQIFDLDRKSLRPVATIRDGAAGLAATCLAFNAQNRRLLAAGRCDGSASVWSLGPDLTEPRPGEARRLERLANQAAD